MKTELFFDILGDADPEKVRRAGEALAQKARPHRRKWVTAATAACLCLAVGAAVWALRPEQNPKLDAGSGAGLDGVLGDVPGGTWPEGIDPVMASVAVFPETEDLQDVETATLTSIDRETAYAVETLGDHLPKTLPEGYAFYNAGLYETTMKNGTRYTLLRVTYGAGAGPAAPVTEDGAELNVPAVPDETFVVSVRDFAPQKVRLHAPDFTAADILEAGQTIHVAYGDGVYVAITPNADLTVEALMELLRAAAPDGDPAA